MGRFIINNIDSSQRRSKARRHLIKKYGCCAITGYTDPLEYQSAHIIPRSIGYNIQFDRVDSPSNCILLANGLHALFDSFSWTLDIYSFLDYGTQSETHFTTTLLIKKTLQPGSSCLCNYVNKQITIPIGYLPSFYVHYNVYLHHNYTVSEQSVLQLFQHYLNTTDYQAIKNFQRTSEFKEYFNSKRLTKDTIRVIIGHDKDTYHILWQYWGLSYVTYDPKETINIELVETYNNYLEHLEDPNWSPTDELK